MKTPENQVKWVNENEKIYNSTFNFGEDTPIEIKRRIICKEKECNRYELLM